MSAIVEGTYNPGMNPFAPQPTCRFDGNRTLGEAGVCYEFNVKLRVPCSCSNYTWDQEVDDARRDFELAARKRWPWIGEVGFTGRSGGWLSVADPQGRMTERTLRAMAKAVDKALRAFKAYMVRTYPQYPRGMP